MLREKGWSGGRAAGQRPPPVDLSQSSFHPIRPSAYHILRIGVGIARSFPSLDLDAVLSDEADRSLRVYTGVRA